MPFALLFIGILIITTAIKKTHTDLFVLLKDDFTGSGNFIYWILSIIVLVGVGYNKTLRPLSDAFLALLIIVLILSNKGFFAKFQSEIAKGTATKNSASAIGAIGGDSVKSVFNAVAGEAVSETSQRVGKIGIKLAGSGGFVY